MTFYLIGAPYLFKLFILTHQLAWTIYFTKGIAKRQQDGFRQYKVRVLVFKRGY